jgi:hypothetical protein
MRENWEYEYITTLEAYKRASSVGKNKRLINYLKKELEEIESIIKECKEANKNV